MSKLHGRRHLPLSRSVHAVVGQARFATAGCPALLVKFFENRADRRAGAARDRIAPYVCTARIRSSCGFGACTNGDSVSERFFSPFADRTRREEGLRNFDALLARHLLDQPDRRLRGARRGAEPPKEYQEP